MINVEMDKDQQIAMAWRVRATPMLPPFERGVMQASGAGIASRALLTPSEGAR